MGDRSTCAPSSGSWKDSNIDIMVVSGITDIAGSRIHWGLMEGLSLMNVEGSCNAGTKFIFKCLFDILRS